MKNLLIIHDLGDFWKITGTDKKDESFLVQRDKYQEVCPEELQEVEKLLWGNVLTYPKNQYFFFSNIIKSPEDGTILTKQNAIGKIKKNFEDRFTVFDYFNFFKFTVINTDLNSLGYHLTYSQKSEVEEIISKESDPEVSKKIRDYFLVLDSVEDNMAEYEKVTRAIDRIKNCHKQEDIKKILDEF